jgi:GNAT superfamily N-acetyltransferase
VITFATEDWRDIVIPILALWKLHHTEVADPRDVERIPLDPDWEKYQTLADRGCLHVTGVRENGLLVGYAFVVVDTGLHYRTTLFGHWDLYFVLPEARARNRWIGVKLFREVESVMRARGVKKMTNRRKTWLDTGPIFRRLGWRDDEIGSSKWIGG